MKMSPKLVTIEEFGLVRVGYYDRCNKFVLHNPNGPAYYEHGPRGSLTMYMKFGKLHRIGGPARIFEEKDFRYVEYYNSGERISCD